MAERLRFLADIIEAGKLDPVENELFENSVIPALGYLLDKELDYFAVVAYGDSVSIQDWINSPEASLFEASGRLHALADIMGSAALQQEAETADGIEAVCNDCEGCELEVVPPRQEDDVN
jgi:hypothetical protein